MVLATITTSSGYARWTPHGHHETIGRYRFGGPAVFVHGVAFPHLAGTDGAGPYTDRGRLLVRVLGPLSVCRGDREVPIGKARTRAVLAMLIIHGNAVVPTDVIADELWSGAAPESARHAVQVAVSSLRSVLGAEQGDSTSDRLLAFPGGYMLALGHRELDVSIAEELAGKAVALADRGSLEDAENCYLTAEGLWRGPPYSEFLYSDFAQTEIRRLEEYRLGLIEDRIAVQLDRELHHEIVPELEALVMGHPSRERMLCQLMLALYRADRPLDAELAYVRAATQLRDEYDSIPGPSVTALARRIHIRQLEPP